MCWASTPYIYIPVYLYFCIYISIYIYLYFYLYLYLYHYIYLYLYPYIYIYLYLIIINPTRILLDMQAIHANPTRILSRYASLPHHQPTSAYNYDTCLFMQDHVNKPHHPLINTYLFVHVSIPNYPLTVTLSDPWWPTISTWVAKFNPKEYIITLRL